LKRIEIYKNNLEPKPMKLTEQQLIKKAAETGLNITKTSTAKYPFSLWHDDELVAQAKTLEELPALIDKFEKNYYEVVKYATGTFYAGIYEYHETLKEAKTALYSYTAEEMYDNDDHAILFSILGNGESDAIMNYRPHLEAVPEATKPEPAPSKRYSPQNKALLLLSTSTLKAEVLETLNFKNAAQAAKWAKSQGMDGIDLCYKTHWAALVEKVRSL
jgi:hypothetical protein